MVEALRWLYGAPLRVDYAEGEMGVDGRNEVQHLRAEVKLRGKGMF